MHLLQRTEQTGDKKLTGNAERVEHGDAGDAGVAVSEDDERICLNVNLIIVSQWRVVMLFISY